MYSIINVEKDNGDTVDGYWIEDCCRGIVQAKEKLKSYQNSEYKGNYALTEKVNSTIPNMQYWTNLKKIK